MVRAVHQSGAIDRFQQLSKKQWLQQEMVQKKLMKLKDTAAQVEETAIAAREIGKAMRHLTQHINRSAIVTSETVREAATKVKSKKKRQGIKYLTETVKGRYRRTDLRLLTTHYLLKIPSELLISKTSYMPSHKLLPLYKNPKYCHNFLLDPLRNY